MALKISSPSGPQPDEQTRMLFGSHCPLVCLVRVRPLVPMDEDGTIPMFYVDEDSRMKAGAHLDVIRQDPDRRQFVQENFLLVSPMMPGGKEKVVKHFPLRPQQGEKLVIALKGWKKLFGDLDYKWICRHSEEIEKHIDIFDCDYGLQDLQDNKEEPEELAKLPRRLKGITIYSPEKAEFTRTDQDESGKEFERTVPCKPRFFGQYCYQDALEQTPNRFKSRNMLNITGMPVGIHPFVLRVDVKDALEWRPYHILALHNATNGVEVHALDEDYWSSVGLIGQSSVACSITDSLTELLNTHSGFTENVRDTLIRLGAARVADKVLKGNVGYFEKMKGVGQKTAELIVNKLGGWAEAYREHPDVLREQEEKVLH